MKKLLVILILASWVSAKRNFTPPDSEARNRAIGSTVRLSVICQRAFDPAQGFKPKGHALPGDWLDKHKEKGQSYRQFMKDWHQILPNNKNTIYLQPLGQFNVDSSISIDILEQYAYLYFCLPVVMPAAAPLKSAVMTSRINSYTGKPQVLVSDMLDLIFNLLKPDAFCMIGVTMVDLYPEPSWDFVFGQASPEEKVAVYSFARYDPVFNRGKRLPNYRELLKKRACKILTHELGHLFGIAHCIYFNCVMNGANTIEENDLQPMHLCPVCLRKLHSVVGFDIIKRYSALKDFYIEHGFMQQAEWTQQRIEYIKSKGSK